MMDNQDNAVSKPSRLTLLLKRVFDVALSAVSIIVLAPIIPIIAIAIKLDSPGPVFYRQKRHGRGGKLFKIFKFRSMVHNLDQAGIALTVQADQRITKVGAFLRDHKLDELPQLFNVFAGDMSFVGPRPEVPSFMKYYSPEQREIILSMQPGITDYASLAFRNESDLIDGADDPVEIYRTQIMPAKFELYERYSREIGLGTDLRLIFGTLALLLTDKAEKFGIAPNVPTTLKQTSHAKLRKD